MILIIVKYNTKCECVGIVHMNNAQLWLRVISFAVVLFIMIFLSSFVRGFHLILYRYQKKLHFFLPLLSLHLLSLYIYKTKNSTINKFINYT